MSAKLDKDSSKALLDGLAEAGVPLAQVADALVPTIGPGGLAKPAAPPAKPKKKGPTRRTVVKRVTDERSGVSVDVVLDAQTGWFRADVPGYPTPIMGQALGPVVTETARILQAAQEYQWKPSIVVDVGRDGAWFRSASPDLRRSHHQNGGCHVDHIEASVAVSYYRLDIAPKPGDPTRFVCRPHEDDVTAEDADTPSWATKNATARREKGDDVGDFLERGEAIVMPYTPELWAAVEQCAEELLDVGKRLRELLKRPDLLTAAGTRLLLASDTSTILALPSARAEEADEA